MAPSVWQIRQMKPAESKMQFSSLNGPEEGLSNKQRLERLLKGMLSGQIAFPASQVVQKRQTKVPRKSSGR